MQVMVCLWWKGGFRVSVVAGCGTLLVLSQELEGGSEGRVKPSPGAYAAVPLDCLVTPSKNGPAQEYAKPKPLTGSLGSGFFLMQRRHHIRSLVCLGTSSLRSKAA
jgi:hypothetical protein